MKRLLLIPLLLLAALPLGAQSGILASSRYVDWTKAGLPPTLPDSETTTNPYTPPTRTQCGSTISSGASVATINAALAGCAHGTYVLLGPGTFTVNTGSGCYANSNTCIELYNNSGVTLRGSGPQSTTIALSNYGEINFGVTWNNSVVNVTSGLSQGSNSIVIPSITGAAGTLVVGQLLQFNQCDSGYSGTPCTGSSTDNGGLYVCGDNNACQIGSDTGNNNHQIQVSRVTAISGSGPYTITFSPALYMPNWTTASTANVTWSSSTSGGGTAEPYGNALEDLTVYVTSSSANEAVYLGRTYSSWVKGVRFVGGAQSNDISFFGCLSCLVSNNYFFSDIALDALYPPPVQESGATLDLLLNNIMASGVPWEGDGSNVANVNAFNYGRDTFTAYNENQPFDHHAGSSFDLHEGEVNGPSLPGDNTWGTHNLDTYFRNYVETFDTPYITALNNPRGMQLDNWQRFINLVGNSIGPGPASNPLTTYQASSGTSLFSFSFGSSDSLTLASSLRWGNSDSVTNTTRFVSSEIPTSLSGNAAPFSNPVPSTHNLPCSFFLSGYTGTTCTPTYSGGTGLSFWKVCKTWTTFPTSCATTQTQPFPPVGPDITSGPYVNGTAYYNPAVIAWQYLPIDPTYQNSYTITGSSWSGGAETLTVSSLPNTTHLMGGFQTSGVTSACLPSGIINGEIMMTGSSTTTVTYALAANPGVSCTGTMKFPDVREFDERVYETDSGGSAYTITVSSIVGHGTVTSSDSVINCTTGTTGTCTDSSATGTVTLTFTAASGYTLTGVTGCTLSGTTCSVTSAATITATFTANCTTTCYLSPSGSDSNPGTSSFPWLTPNHSETCGNVIIALTGTYAASSFQSGKWGAVTCSGNNNVVWVECATFDACKISAGANYGMYVDHSYWGVQGFEATTSSSGFTGFAAAPPVSSPSAGIHHIIFANDVVNGAGGGALGSFASGSYGVDYLVIIGNIAFNGAQNSLNCYSGISVFEPQASDSVAGTHIYVAGNYVYGNVDPSTCASTASTDGDGVILDTFNNFSYCQQAVVQNNILVANGGHGFEKQGKVTNPTCAAPTYVKNNTVWGNLSAIAANTTLCAEWLINEDYGITGTGNIVQANRATGCSSNPTYNMYAYNTSGTIVGARPASSVSANFIGPFSGTTNTGVSNIDSNTFAFGSNTTGTSPGFANPVEYSTAPSCGSSANVPGCMSTLIADFTASTASAFGYQTPSGTSIVDPLYPAWLCNVTLPSGLVTPGCSSLPPVSGVTVNGIANLQGIGHVQ